MGKEETGIDQEQARGSPQENTNTLLPEAAKKGKTLGEDRSYFEPEMREAEGCQHCAHVRGRVHAQLCGMS